LFFLIHNISPKCFQLSNINRNLFNFGRCISRDAYAALTSTRHNPALKIFYQRLIKAGKSAKVAIIAVMRKLLSIVNSVMKRRTIWESNVSIPRNTPTNI
jgi:transposase